MKTWKCCWNMPSSRVIINRRQALNKVVPHFVAKLIYNEALGEVWIVVQHVYIHIMIYTRVYIYIYTYVIIYVLSGKNWDMKPKPDTHTHKYP